MEIGTQVSKFKVGDNVGVGCLVDSCRACASCQENLEQYCENGLWARTIASSVMVKHLLLAGIPAI
jgi:D-arabinose 1-dehydrogenase-like Zn-dependent alcohol dehydrogenase